MPKATKIIIGIVIIAVIAVLVSVYENQRRTSPEIIKIGAILPLSGSAAAMGENAQHGIEMALSSLGENRNKYSVIFEDDQFNTQKTVDAFNKLVNVDAVKYVITLGSNNSNAIAPIAEEKQIVHIAISTDPKVLDYRFSIKNGSDPVELARVMAEEVARRGYQRVYVVVSNHEGVLSIVNQFKERDGMKERIVGEQLVDPSESDFRTMLSKAKTENPDALLLEIIPGKVGIAAKQARELGITVPLFAAVVFEDQNTINAAAGSLEGQWYVNSSVSNDFAVKFRERFNHIPSREAGNGFDTIVAIHNAVIAVGPDPTKVNEYLHRIENIDSQSIEGGMVNQNGNFINFAIVKIVENGQFVKYNR